ncbi:MAG TPA: hypothetical protein PLJ27_25910 [Polyangiaceae bacterium]|jgi:hypothetical protein|nr:MAG: hypothetical protein BWY17_01615 [Deltaproteobacteria bacterium ADurb.Bin207]HNS97502.1 hypothetical protein [Polyangiaceae bacterium]HNZ22728.1 hypothetical protein [Polyangiaceae bacterium]HOD24380.1 hypothetical protein [Polyangiaceae bacterium]HOH01141.1 hypothetical protein [Polyangiaceae bacterium]
MGYQRARCSVVVSMVITTACAGAAKAPVDTPPSTSKEDTAGGSTKAPASATEHERSHPASPCLVQAVTTRVCFHTKAEACASMGCPVERCSYLYGGGAPSVVACDD